MSETLFDAVGDVRKGALLSDDGVYRYTLTRDWSDPNAFVRQFATFVMLNPSTADADDDDPTILRCMKFARSWGLHGIASKPAVMWEARVVNLYAFRALGRGVDIIGPDNGRQVDRALLQAYNTCAPVAAAWGNNGSAERVRWLRREAAALSVDLECFGTTLSGAPTHPLARGQHRIPDGAQLERWVER